MRPAGYTVAADRNERNVTVVPATARQRKSRHLAIAALCAALALAGCGRKGPLEPPPGSPAAQREAEQQRQPQGLGQGLVLPRTAEPATTQPPQEPAAPRGEDRRFPLDFLLN